MPVPKLNWWCPSLDYIGNGTGTLYDLSGNNNNATLTNMDAATDWITDTDRGGKRALDFDGINDYVATVNTRTGIFTVSLWFNRRTTGSDGGRIVFGNISSGNTYLAFVRSTDVRVQSDNIATLKTFGGFSITNNVWYHLVVKRDINNNVRVYIDGIESTSGPQAIVGTFTLNALGRYYNASGSNAPYQWDGLIDDVRSYNIELNETQIIMLSSQRGYKLSYRGRRKLR